MDRCTLGCPPFVSCIGCACILPKVKFPAYPAAEDIPVGQRPFLRSVASRYLEKPSCVSDFYDYTFAEDEKRLYRLVRYGL